MHFPQPLHEGFVRIRRALEPRATVAAAAGDPDRGLKTTTSRYTGAITGTIFISNGHTITQAAAPAAAAATTPAVAAAGAATTPAAAGAAAVTTPAAAADGPSAKLATTGPKARVTTTAANGNNANNAATGQTLTTPVTSSPSSAASAAASDKSTASNKSTSSSHTGTIVGVVIAVIVVLALIAGFLFWRKKRSSCQSGGAFAKHNSDGDFGTISPSSGGYGATKEKDFVGGFSGPVAAGGARTDRQPSWDEAPSYRTDAPSPYPPTMDQHQSPFGDQARVAPVAMAMAKPYGQQKTLPAIQEQKPPAQSPFMDSPGQGQVYVVRNTFEPTQQDELIIYPGDRVQVLVQYDDGWALGINLDSGTPPSKGVFPFDCVAAPQSKSYGAGSPTGEDKRALTPVSQQPPQLAPLARSDSPITVGIPASLQPGAADGKVKRTSSLIASRDANLFVALGDVGGKDGRSPA